ncbi:MAG: F0F1 ATP synthase subunit alpha [Patescibacteria group bacterium]
MSNPIIEKLQKEIKNFSNKSTVESIGTVVQVADGVVEIEGLEGVKMSEMVRFSSDTSKALEEVLDNTSEVYGLILNLEEDVVKAVVMGDASGIKEGDMVVKTGEILSVPVSEEILGRVVDTLARPIDGKGAIKEDKQMLLEREAYSVIDRAPVNTPLQTGIKSIDALIPIGRGQRELIIGDRGTGKTTIAIDTIINQKYEPEAKRPICIYVAIGQKESKTAKIVEELRQAGALEYSVIVSAPASRSATEQFLAPFTGVAIAEYFMDQGKDVLIAYDDLSKQAAAYRQMSLLLRRPPGREAYPGDVFYLHSRLLERSAKVHEGLGGGSITALPIIETQEGDVSGFIPTNVISITDGQIFLDTNLFNKGILPAIDVGLSVSRVGSSAQTKAMKKVSGRIKVDLAQFRELEAFMQFSSDLDENTREKIESSVRVVEMLKQKNSAPLPFEKQVVTLYFVSNGFARDFEVDTLAGIEKELHERIEAEKPEILGTIRESGKLEDDTRDALHDFLEHFVVSKGVKQS